MPEKWNKGTVLKYAEELRSPFEEQAEKKTGLAGLGDRLREVMKKKVV